MTAACRVGVLALQGGFSAHADAFSRVGVECIFIKKPHQLSDIDLLVIPGGESTALEKLMSPLRMQDAIINFAKNGGNIFATCAGLILLATTIADDDSPSANPKPLALLDITVQRNAYGRQAESHVVIGDANQQQLGVTKLQMPFIRAPKITRLGDAVQVMATYKDQPVMVKQDNIIAASFHPELTKEDIVTKYLLQNCPLRSC